MKVSMILNYPIRKEMLLLDVGNRYIDDLTSIKHGIKKIMEAYVKTEAGKEFFEMKKRQIFLCDFASSINDIPKYILDEYKIHPCSASRADHVVTFNAMEELIGLPICAVFGKYDESYPLSKHEMDHLMRSVNLYDDIYLYRPLILNDGQFVGFGFVSDEVIDDDGFSLPEFLKAAAETVYERRDLSGEEIHENQGHYYKLIKLDR